VIEVTRVQSHSDPKRYLKQHVAEILAAAESLFAQHGGAPWCATGHARVVELARLHDLGKGTAAFQAYIAAPDTWGGEPREKSHTLLSQVLATAWASDAPDDAVRLITLALGVRGHHGSQPHDDATLRATLLDDAWNATLVTQLRTLDREGLAGEVGFELPPLDDPERLLGRVIRALRRAQEAWRAQVHRDMVRARFEARAAYSVLLEADKAFLAIDRAVVKAYLHRPRPSLSSHRVDALCGSLVKTPMDALRARAGAAALEGFARTATSPLRTLTLPTGAGKTLIAARWALSERASNGDAGIDAPTVILALPMLSIVDQTERVWRSLLEADDDDGDTLLPFHSLSERSYDSELPGGTADFFIDTWRSEVIVTTFDQLLLAMYSDRAKHALRYHRLLNARIVIDEVQCVPPVLWAAVSEGLRALCESGRTRVLAMSATPSRCLDDAGAVEVLDDPDALYADLARYELHLELTATLAFEQFVASVIERCAAHLARGEGTLVTVNVRATAQETWERLDAAGLAPLLLSGDMTPDHRLKVIATLSKNSARVVVSTQCVEAGVDLDMHHVIRDLAPLDALVQIAGRCNRHAHRTSPGTVTVVHIRGASGRDDAADVYDPVLLQCTREVLGGRVTVAEREVLSLCRAWFTLIAARKNKGTHHVAQWARIEAALDVRDLLRGGDDDARQVLVTERDPSLRPALLAALAVPDRWARRAALRELSARLARHSVSVSPKVFAALTTRPIGAAAMWSELTPGQYHPVRGIDARRRA
jgi:CRISPR-associated endonuclease/helicase Cas3